MIVTSSTNSGSTFDGGGVLQSYSTRTVLVPSPRAQTAPSVFASSTRTQATPAFSLVTVDVFVEGCESKDYVTRVSQSRGCCSRQPVKLLPIPLVCGRCHDAVSVSITAPHPRKITQLTIDSALDLSLKLVLFFLSSNVTFSACLTFRCGSGWWGEVCCFKTSLLFP